MAQLTISPVDITNNLCLSYIFLCLQSPALWRMLNLHSFGLNVSLVNQRVYLNLLAVARSCIVPLSLNSLPGVLFTVPDFHFLRNEKDFGVLGNLINNLLKGVPSSKILILNW